MLTTYLTSLETSTPSSFSLPSILSHSLPPFSPFLPLFPPSFLLLSSSLPPSLLPFLPPSSLPKPWGLLKAALRLKRCQRTGHQQKKNKNKNESWQEGTHTVMDCGRDHDVLGRAKGSLWRTWERLSHCGGTMSRLCVLVSSEKPLREAVCRNPCSLCAAGRALAGSVFVCLRFACH